MPRPHKHRYIGQQPPATLFKPAGIPARTLETVELRLDELEALRLADLDGHYQDHAAAQMNISRPTFGRLLDAAHQKVADALLNGKALMFAGGAVAPRPERVFACSDCGTRFHVPPGTDRPNACPNCGSGGISRVHPSAPPMSGNGRCGGGGRRRRCRGGRPDTW